VLVVGASDEDTTEAWSGSEIYDPSNGRFSLTGPLIFDRSGQTATLLSDGRVLVAGGRNLSNSAGVYLSAAEIYDPTTGQFTRTGSMRVARENATATLLPDGRVLFTGGDQGLSGTYGQGILASAEIYDPVTGKFTLTGSMEAPRLGQSATLLPDGTVLIVGGRSRGGIVVASAEIYNPATGKFTPTGSMTVPRSGHTATLLGDGRVLVAGGANDEDIDGLASAELYDPNSGQFAPTGPMTTTHVDDQATLLRDGRVLITGDTSELYWP
jgi:N-acetylneuraminic acid mutarotase